MTRTRSALLTIVVAAAFLVPGKSAWADEPYIELDALQVQEHIADVLDTYERIFKTYDTGFNSVYLTRIEEARGYLFDASLDDLQIMGSTMGAEIVTMKAAARRQAETLLVPGDPDLDTEFKQDLEVVLRSSTPTFPSLRPDVPEYPSGTGTSSGTIDEDTLESYETDLEAQEEDREDGEAGGSVTSSLCDKMALASGRANRRSASDRFFQLDLLIVTRIANAVSHDICAQAICPACCIVSSIITGIAEGLFDAVELCEDFVDGAEVEAAYHNTRTIFNAVEHIHNDVDGVGSSISSLATSLSTHDTKIANLVNTHDTKISSALTTHDTNISGALTTHDTKIANAISAHDTKLSNAVSTHDANMTTQVTNHHNAITSTVGTHDTEIKALLGTTQATLDNEVELRRVHVEIVEILEKKDYLVLTTEGGQPVDVDFLSIQVSKATELSFMNAMSDTTITALGTGFYHLAFDTPPSVTDVIYVGVRHDDVVDHYGQAVFHRGAL